MGGIKIARRERLDGIRKKALDVLNSTDLDSIYDAASLESGDGSVDSAMKVILAEKLVDSICMAKRYAKRAKIKRIGASAVLIAAQENRW